MFHNCLELTIRISALPTSWATIASGEDSRYLWIAEQALCAPLPEGWREMEDHLGNTFYLLTDEVGEVHTAWEHPHDEFYRELFANLKVGACVLYTCACMSLLSVCVGGEGARAQACMAECDILRL
jgi:hypothetical protein